MKLVVFPLLAILLVTSCAGSSDVSGDRRVIDDMTIAFTITPARADVGKSVRFALRMTNHGGRVRKLDFSSGQLYDFWVTRNSEEVWRWSDDQAFTQALQTKTIPSQDSLTLSEAWPPSATGEYVAHGVLKAKGFDRELTGKVTVHG
jgi:hypothetical protein